MRVHTIGPGTTAPTCPTRAGTEWQEQSTLRYTVQLDALIQHCIFVCFCEVASELILYEFNHKINKSQMRSEQVHH